MDKTTMMYPEGSVLYPEESVLYQIELHSEFQGQTPELIPLKKVAQVSRCTQDAPKIHPRSTSKGHPSFKIHNGYGLAQGHHKTCAVGFRVDSDAT